MFRDHSISRMVMTVIGMMMIMMMMIMVVSVQAHPDMRHQTSLAPVPLTSLPFTSSSHSDLLAQTSLLSRSAQQPLRQQTYMYGDFKLPPPPTPPMYFPADQFCPDTGRTVCRDVQSYPTDSILNLVLEAKARKFNFSSLFVDERDHNLEPILPPVPPRSSPSVIGRTPYAAKSNGVKGKPDVERPSVIVPTAGPSNGSSITTSTMTTTVNSQTKNHDNRPTMKVNEAHGGAIHTSPLSVHKSSNRRIAATVTSTESTPIPEAEPIDPLDRLHSSELHAQHQPNKDTSFDLHRLPKPESSPKTKSRSSSSSDHHRSRSRSTEHARSRLASTVDRSSYTMHVIPLSAPLTGLLTKLDQQLNRWQKPSISSTPSGPSSAQPHSTVINNKSPCCQAKSTTDEVDASSEGKSIEQTQIDFEDERLASDGMWPPVQSILNQMQSRQFQFHPLSRSLQSLPVKSQQRESNLDRLPSSLSNRTPSAQLMRYRRDSMAQTDQDQDSMPEEVCRSRHMYITPKTALNDRSQWRFIVNLGDKDTRLRQVIKVDVCVAPNEPCSNQIQLPFGYISRCKQKYIKKKLLALDPDGKGTSTENFFVPSCCVCEIIKQRL